MRGIGAVVVAVLSSLGQGATVQVGDAVDRLKECPQIEGLEQPECVERPLRQVVQNPNPAPPPASNWIISETTSPVDYKPQVAALTTARVSSPNAPSSLAIHCRARRTELIVSTAGSWKPDGDVRVAYKINEEPLVEARWKPEDAGRSVVFLGDVVRLLRSMPDSGQLFVRVQVGRAPPYESTFQLAGIDSVRRKIAAACNWP